MKKMNKKGFTLVELVIVIAVIAILAAVLIPVFSNIIGNAKESANLADARNVYEQYVVDAADKEQDIAKDLIIVIKAETTGNSDGVYFAVKDGILNSDPVETLDAAKALFNITGKTTVATALSEQYIGKTVYTISHTAE